MRRRDIRAERKASEEARWAGAGPLEHDGYWCVVCARFLPEDEWGVIVHDAIPHPSMTFDDEERPQ